jgi:hypothetical protein
MIFINPYTSKLDSTSDYNTSQIKVAAFIQGMKTSYCFNKSKENLKSHQFIR